jgi:uncharacterized protein (TIGR03435 family)
LLLACPKLGVDLRKRIVQLMTDHAGPLPFHRMLWQFATGLPVVVALVIFLPLFEPLGNAQPPSAGSASPGAAAPAVASEVKLPPLDVVSVKPNKSGSGGMRIMFNSDGYSATNVSAKMLIQMAYGIREDLISGAPGWAGSTRYDFDAKVAAPDVEALKKLNPEQRRSMLQPALADRFNLKVHTEIKQLPVYELVVAKGGSKLKEATPGDTYPNGFKDPKGVGRGGMMRAGPGQLSAQGIQMSSLVNTLAQQLHRTVVDKTGLAGDYDFTLQWTEETPDTMFKGSDGAPQRADPAPDATGPSIFTAIQEQLGLKLQSAKGPVETLVIDHIEAPSEN